VQGNFFRNKVRSSHLNRRSDSATTKVNPKLIKYAEWIVAILLSATVLFVFFVRATHAGGLWREECDFWNSRDCQPSPTSSTT